MMGGVDPAGFELLPEAVVVIDPEMRIVHVNARAHRLLGLGPDSVGEPLPEVLDLLDDSGAHVSDCLVPKASVAERLAERTLRVHLGGGDIRPVSVAGAVLEDGGALLTFRHAGRRERVDAARSDLIATVSHEIRSPLTSVKGYTRTMLVKWERFSDEQKRHMLTTINADADRVTRLLTELLDVARIDAGRVQLHRLVTDVMPVLRRVIEKASHAETDRRVVLETPEQLPHLYVDPDKLEQIVTNLVDNALRYAPDSDVVTTVDVDEEHVTISVADRGPGIASDQLRSIFGKFSRGRGNKRSGTGLGLYITKGLAEAHGGRVWVDSGDGTGATFHVELPRGGIELGVEDLDVVVEEA